MKKITFLMMLLPVYMFAQDSWTFDSSTEDWTATGFDIGSPVSGSIVLTASDGSTNPKIRMLTASIDASTKTIAAVTMKVGAEGPQQMRVSFLKLSTPNAHDRVYKDIDISKGDSAFRTYYVDCTDTDWTGTIENLQIFFEGLGGVDYTGTSSALETVEIDKIEFLSAIPITEKADYRFSSDNYTDGWIGSNATVSVSNGNLVFSPEIAGSAARIEQTLHNVDTNNNYLHIRINNQSPNDNIRLRDGAAAYVEDLSGLAINQAADTYSSYVMHITSAKWPTGGSNFEVPFIEFRDSQNGNKASAGTILIDYIVFNQTTLVADSAVKEQSGISVYPNPVKDQLNIASEKTIIEVSILNTVGKLVAKGNSAKLATDALPAGVYLVSVVFEDGQTHSQKIIKE